MTAGSGPRLAGIGSHHSANPQTDDWWTPPHILEALGPFDLDPCAPVDRPSWTGCPSVYTAMDDGLSQPWEGRVWVNPPYSEVEAWMRKLARHGAGTALVFARCETKWWFDWVWPHASAVLFLRGRLTFYRPATQTDEAPRPSKAGHNSGGPSALIAYGHDDAGRLRASGLAGAFATGFQVQ